MIQGLMEKRMEEVEDTIVHPYHRIIVDRFHSHLRHLNKFVNNLEQQLMVLDNYLQYQLYQILSQNPRNNL